jgi:4-amino-4-deoxy-L-arabinose transferase-like glycosyltransferase
MERTEAAPRSTPTGTIVVLCLLPLTIHLAVNLFGGYGYFRDELYYIACAKRLGAGYVDHPPFSIYVLALVRQLIGDSVFALRLVPAVTSALSVALVCGLVLKMRGGRAALIVAALAFTCSGQLLGYHTFYSMNSLDILLWLVAGYVLVGLAEHPTTGRWLVLGLVLGLGLLNKTSVLWLGAGLAAVLVLTGFRSQLRTRGPWLAGATALLVFSPYVLWNLANGLPHLEFMRNASAEKYSSLTRGRFLVDQFMNMNPPVVLVALLGFGWYLFARDARRFRALGVAFLATLAILLLNPHTKSEYVAAAYTLLFAGGGVAIERLGRRWGRAIPWITGALLVAMGLVVLPLALPILPVETYVRYSQALGLAPSTAEAKELDELPQFFADMHGWEELARNVSAAYLRIPEAERPTTVALVSNYGEAGALEHFARKYALPRVICPHNSYWLWGVGDTRITTFLRLGGRLDDYRESYGDVTQAAIHTCRHCMPYENHLGIFVARERRVPIEQAWGQLKHFE